MKKISIIIAILSFYGAIGQKKSDLFVLEGHASDQHLGRLYLYYFDKDGHDISDSVNLHNGSFTFTGHVNEPQIAFLVAKNDSSKGGENTAQFFLEPGKTRIEIVGRDLKNASISGTPNQQQWSAYRKEWNKIDRRWKIVLDTLHAVNKRSNFEYQELKEWVLSPRRLEFDELRDAFIAGHPTSYVTVSLLQFNVDIPTDSLQKYYDRFPADVRQSRGGKNIAEALRKRKLGVPGTMASDFTAPDIDGRPLSLSDYKGKYVLLDFWASWCLPCRKQSPHLKELYAKYKHKGLEIVGIASDDSKPDAWHAAVAADSLPWRQVLSGYKRIINGDKITSEESKHISKGYNIMTLPTQVLIDPKGRIIARYGGGGEEHEKLDGKLSSIFE